MKNPKMAKLKELVFKNIALKILAIILAIVSWIVIVNVSDPSQRVTVSGISVSLQNEETLIDKGYIYQVESGSSISIVVKGPQTIVENLKASDFYAYADLSERTPGSDTAKIYVKCTNEEISEHIDIVSQKSEFVQLAIDNKIDKDLPINIDISGVPADGYVVGSYSASPTTIKISGAEATVEKIVNATITYDVSSMTADVIDTVVPVFYDSEGKVVKADKLELSRSDVRISIEILPTKWVPINFAVTGTPSEGFALVDYTSNISSVNIAAKKSDLNKLSSIDIPSGVVDVTDAKENTEISVNVASYLPSGYSIVSSITTLKVNTQIEKLSDGIVNVPVEDISIKGLGKDYLYEITTQTEGNVLQVGVKGLDRVVKTLSSKDLNPSIQLAGKRAGEYTVRVILTAGDDFTIPDTYYVKVTISEKEQETETETETEKETESGENTESGTSELENTTEKNLETE